MKLLQDSGVDFERVNYHVEGLTEAQLRALLAKAEVSPLDLLRRKEPLARELGLEDPARSDDELISAMVEHPHLVERPIVERGERAVLARPAERVLEILD